MQYSIRQLLGVTAAAALACAVLFAIPSALSIIVLALGSLWLPVILVCGLIYARNWRRTFFIGATIGAAPICAPLLFYVPVMFYASMADVDWKELRSQVLAEDSTGELLRIKIVFVLFYCYVASVGLLALFTRWLVAPREMTDHAASPARGAAEIVSVGIDVAAERTIPEVATISEVAH